MRTHTAEDLEYDLSLLWAYEGEGTSQAELASREGMSQGHLSRRLARARRYRAEMARRDARETQPCDDDLDRFDYLYMALDAPGIRSSGYATCTSEGQTDVESGKYHVGGRVEALRFGRKAKDENLTDDLTNATSYIPDPAGLKGGVG